VGDIFDALMSERPDKEAWKLEEAFAVFDKMVNEGKLDADCVAALRADIPGILAIILEKALRVYV
jgi:HD-GYP domain-containing protein (c-di-GMP phosphodiesterase class II)